MAPSTMPGVQKPHCTAPRSISSCWSGWSEPFSPSPATVSTRAPSAWTASTLHALTATPSSRTVQAPQTPSPQPYLTSVAPALSRRKCSSVTCGSTGSRNRRPFTTSSSVTPPHPLVPARERADRQRRGRVRVGERAAEGASVPHTRVADVAGCLRGERQQAPHLRVELERPVTRRRADSHPAAEGLDPVQLEPGEVD